MPIRRFKPGGCLKPLQRNSDIFSFHHIYVAGGPVAIHQLNVEPTACDTSFLSTCTLLN